ncbi:c-type cytochrome [Paracoccaceae bacterium Fryx2]|nr:c-type cytochrome [Paracoccaceae bacterium Fryx2]
MAPNPEDRAPVEPAKPRTGHRARRVIFTLGGGLALAAAGTLAFDSALLPGWITGSEQTASLEADAESPFFQPPPEALIPDDDFGAAVRRGRAIFTNTSTNAGQHVGNGLSCSNCHLDAGREPNSAPMWAAWVAYPKYRSKNKQINTMEDRVMGCFSYSMNAQDSVSGGPPPHGDDIYRDLESYFYWMASGAPTNTAMAGGGFGKIDKPALPYDPARGEAVFTANCAVCHGADGLGRKDLNARYLYPPLWGADSYNWGAGMHQINNAAAFIKHNMPYSKPGTLSDQDAWDVAAYVNSHERPKDPRQTGTLEEARLKYHDGDQSYYGVELDGVMIGTGTPRPAAPVGN